MEQMNRPVALQLYSIRHACEADFHDALRRTADLGYDGVEFAGFFNHTGSGLRKTLDATGLKAEGAHISLPLLAHDRLSDTIAEHQELGTNWLILAWLPEEMRNTPEACAETGKKLTAIDHSLHEHGMRLGFHCHHADMQPLSDGKSAWFHIADHTPAGFIMQYDTANGMSGGADPIQPIIDLPGRGASVHLKEWSGSHGSIIGQGQVPWRRVLNACETYGGTEWYVVEYEVDGDPDPIASCGKCLDYLRSL